jgi:chromosome segregation ATPase
MNRRPHQKVVSIEDMSEQELIEFAKVLEAEMSDEMTNEELVKRLRPFSWSDIDARFGVPMDETMREAADRIEQLQQALKEQSSVSDRLAEANEKLTTERNEHWKSFVHWRKEADNLTEQLETARADAKEAEAYAEELEAKVENLTKHHANMADPRYWEGRYRDEKAKLAKAVEALGSIELYGSDTLSGRTDGPADAKWHREGVKEMRDRARATLAEIKGEKL